MIHLTGGEILPSSKQKVKLKVKRALEEIAIFEEEGIDGAIIENHYAHFSIAFDILQEISKSSPKIKLGVNILPNEFEIAFDWAGMFKLQFIQSDYVAGNYSEHVPIKKINRFYEKYDEYRQQLFLNGVVLGGVWPKYYTPLQGSNLEEDLKQGMQRADAIVVTGEGTGKETPLPKIKLFRKIIDDHPLIVGAGLTPQNAYEQLKIADGAIVGTSLKIRDQTENKLDRAKIKDLMDVVTAIRKEYT